MNYPKGHVYNAAAEAEIKKQELIMGLTVLRDQAMEDVKELENEKNEAVEFSYGNVWGRAHGKLIAYNAALNLANEL